ncbi:MAG: TIGR01212 family radical SAM protein [Planctomycetota bacterium]
MFTSQNNLKNKLTSYNYPYYTFRQYLKRRLGNINLYKIPVDAGFTCPNRDGSKGWGGCYYCNNKAFSPNSATKPLPLKTQIKNTIDYYRKRRNAHKFILYFQAYTNTYSTIPKLKEIYDYAYLDEDIIGIAIATRPDCVDEKILTLINSYTEKFYVCVEYGLQTIHNKTLKLINRAHTYDDFLNAIDITQKFSNIDIVAHTIIGLPGESRDEILTTYKEISRLPLDGIKIEHLYIAKDTVFEKWFSEKKIKVYDDFNEYKKLLGDVIIYIPSHWFIERLIGEINSEYVVAPHWGLTKNEILHQIRQYFITNNLYQGKVYNKSLFTSQIS